MKLYATLVFLGQLAAAAVPETVRGNNSCPAKDRCYKGCEDYAERLMKQCLKQHDCMFLAVLYPSKHNPINQKSVFMAAFLCKIAHVINFDFIVLILDDYCYPKVNYEQQGCNVEQCACKCVPGGC